MLGQDHHGLGIEKALVASGLQIGRQFAMQALGTLVIGGEQFGLDAQQVAAVGGRALVDRQADAQVR
ncbi:hypothetical protein D3C84_952400 [compost metagenome]